MAIQIGLVGVIVRAPWWMPKAVIDTVLKKKRPWIEKHARHLSSTPALLVHKFVPGELFWFLGQEYVLLVSDEYFRSLKFNGQSFVVSKYFHHRTKSQFLEWYKKQARTELLQRLELWAEKLGTTYSAVKITSARTRWGSCSGKGTISLSWKLILAPLSVIDYVVVHELTHLTHHNHSKLFWGEVGKMYPEWQTARTWLSEYGAKLIL